MKTIGPTKSVKYLVSTEYEMSREGCQCPDYCRCGTICNARVESISPYNALSLIKEFVDDNANDIEKLLSFLFFRHCIDVDDFEITTCNGYYGQEIDDVTFTDSALEKMQEFNILLASNDIKSIISSILKHHYGFILRDAGQYTDWQIIEVKPDEVNVPKAGASKVKPELYSSLEYGQVPSFYPGCIVVPDKGKWRIIDGFHRWHHYTTSKKRRKVKVLAPISGQD